MKKLVALLVVFVALVGCVTTMQVVDQSIRTRTYDADQKRVLKAALQYFNEKGFAVVMVDKELGIINTDYKSLDKTSAILVGDLRTKVNLSMNEVGGKTKVTANVSMEQKGAFNQWEQAGVSEETAKTLYGRIFDGIQSHL